MKHTYTTLKLVADVYPKILRYKWFGIPTPILVTFGITNRCNLKCDYCFVSPQERINKELSTQQLLDYIDQFIDIGTRHIDLQGGEPTLHPDLGALISRIVGRGATCSMTTNGFRVDRHLDHLKKCHSVCISIDGLPETTDSHRGKGAYEIAAKALDIMVNAGISVRMHGTLTYTTTCQDIDHCIALAKKYKIKVNFVYALDTGINQTGCDDKMGFDQAVKRIAMYILELKNKGAPIISKTGAIRQVLNWPFGVQDILIETEMPKKQKRTMKDLFIPRCLWGHLACFFNPDGKLYLCPRGYDREGFFIQIGNKTIREAFHELAKFRPCYMCGQMGDLSHSIYFGYDNIRTWLRF